MIPQITFIIHGNISFHNRFLIVEKGYLEYFRVRSFEYLGVNISEDLTWTTLIQTPVWFNKARQILYHLRQLRKFRVSPAILKMLTQCISVWYGNVSNQDCKALQRVVRLADHISGVCSPLSAGHLPQMLQKQSC